MRSRIFLAIFHCFAVSACAFATLIARVPTAEAFIVSEEKQFQADIDEAKSRARDFQRTMDRLAEEEKRRESFGYEQTEINEREAADYEKQRRDFVNARDREPDQGVIQESLEREYLRAQETEEREMDQARRKYIVERDRVREVLRRDAYINEMVEYGLVP